MVARLAERLKKDGSDLDGWLQLMRSYVVLGERDKALSAAAEARVKPLAATRISADASMTSSSRWGWTVKRHHYNRKWKLKIHTSLTQIKPLKCLMIFNA